jgi:hypothetical protein
MAIETSVEAYASDLRNAFYTLVVRDGNSTRSTECVELDGPDAWELYQRLESFIKEKATFPEAILAFEFDEGYEDESHRPEAWEPSLFSPCCGSDVEGIYAEQETIWLDIGDVHDGGHVSLDSSDGDGSTLLYICASCYKGVSLPAEITAEW